MGGIIRGFGRHARKQAAAFALPLDVDLQFGKARRPGERNSKTDMKAGSASSAGRPDRSFSVRPRSSNAERLTSDTCPVGSIPITPALTPASIASVKRRLASTASFARPGGAVLMAGHRLKVRTGSAGPPGFDNRHLGIEFTTGHAPRGIKQPHHGRHDLVGKPQAHPDRCQQEDEAQGHTSCRM